MKNNTDWEKVKQELETKGKVKIEPKNNYVRDKNEPFIFYDPDKEKYYEDLNKNDIRMKKHIDFNSNKKSATLLNFNSNAGFENFKLLDLKAQKLRKEKILNGTAEKNAFETLSNFKPDELNNKLKFMMMIANNEKKQNIVKKYIELSSSGKLDRWEKGNITKEDVEEIFPPNKGGERIAENDAIKIIQNESKNNNKLYKNYEILESFVDEKTGVSGYVAGNKEKGTIEIFFAGSNDPRNMLTDSKTRKDWKNNFESGIITPPNYDNPGPYIIDNKILAVIPGNGEGMLNRAQKIPGSRYSTLYPKTAVSEGKGIFKTSAVTAIAVPTAMTGIKFEPFKVHFPEPEGSAKELESLQKYTEKVKPIYERYYKDKIKIKFNSNKTDLGKLVDKQIKENKISKTNFDKKWQARQ